MNVEYRSKAFYLILLKRLSKAKPHFNILRFDIRYSTVRFSTLTPIFIKGDYYDKNCQNDQGQGYRSREKNKGIALADA